ncbi:hypothetical protein T484DRAFT_1835207 [Baffinella frigidus]|nr:hypothetical protein T484DRAFT_1835207 [Cryptophyta sp. CCMP2293]
MVPAQLEVAAGETIGALRGRVAQQVGGGATSVLLLAGQKLEDGDAAANVFKNEDEARTQTLLAPRLARVGNEQVPSHQWAAAGGAINGQAAALAASLMERMRQSAPQGAAARARPAPGAAGGAGPAHAAPQAAAGGHAGGGGGGAAQAEREIVKQLLDMGFSDIKAKAAVRQTDVDLMDAVTWLSDHAEEPDAFFTDKAQAPRPAAAAVPRVGPLRSSLLPFFTEKAQAPRPAAAAGIIPT